MDKLKAVADAVVNLAESGRRLEERMAVTVSQGTGMFAGLFPAVGNSGDFTIPFDTNFVLDYNLEPSARRQAPASCRAASNSTPTLSSAASARSFSIARTRSSLVMTRGRKLGLRRVADRDVQAQRRRAASLHRRRLDKLVNLWPASRIDELMPWARPKAHAAHRLAA